jgi:hypothetical protein
MLASCFYFDRGGAPRYRCSRDAISLSCRWVENRIVDSNATWGCKGIAYTKRFVEAGIKRLTVMEANVGIGDQAGDASNPNSGFQACFIGAEDDCVGPCHGSEGEGCIELIVVKLDRRALYNLSLEDLV